MFEFREITIEDKNIIKRYIKEKEENSELCFTNLLIWEDCYKTQFAQVDDVLVIMNISPQNKYLCFFPTGSGDVKKVLIKLYDYFKSKGEKLFITNANEDEAKLFMEVFPHGTVTENFEFEDYVYLRESLSNLSGKKLHAKKNHLNRFKKLYPGYVYRPMIKDDFKECINLAQGLVSNSKREGEISEDCEIASIQKIFDNFENLELFGGIIEIDGAIAAFTVAEKLTEDTAVIHVEKADTIYQGAYTAINNEFVNSALKDFEFVNREEDMGIEGLRKAKLSYRPYKMIKKFRCVVE